MLKFAANLNFFYAGKPLFEAFALAKADGFSAVEFVSPYANSPEDVVAELKKNNLTAALFNGPAGDWAAGERGLTVLPGRDAEFTRSVESMIAYAKALGVKNINVMAGVVKEPEPCEKRWDRLVGRLREAASGLKTIGVNALVEHINNYDMPGYFVDTPAMALKAVEAVGMDNCKIQYDVYHAARSSGELTRFLRDHFDAIGHIQIADNPGRNQPGTGEINYKFILGEIDRLGYKGYIGLEYSPKPGGAESLAWVKEMGYSL